MKARKSQADLVMQGPPALLRCTPFGTEIAKHHQSCPPWLFCFAGFPKEAYLGIYSEKLTAPLDAE